MRITVLGSAAGGGFPQWNCNCRNCAGLRNGSRARQGAHPVVDLRQRPTTSADGVLFNASPDILRADPRAPRAAAGAARCATPAIAGVVLMDGQIDHATGLFMLRERGRRCRCGAPTRSRKT